MNAIIAAKKAISLRACIVISEVPGKEVWNLSKLDLMDFPTVKYGSLVILSGLRPLLRILY